MSIRKKITLLITGAGFLASLFFYGVIFWEMIKQPLRIIDSGLESTGRMAARLVLPTPHPVFPESDRYWLKIYDRRSKKILYESDLAKLVDIPRLKHSSRSTFSTIVTRKHTQLGQNWRNEVTFRIRRFVHRMDGRSLIIQVGRPIENLEEETWEIAIGIAGALALSTLLLLVISHFVAGLILKPLGAINNLAQDINEKNLDQRLPVGSSRDEFNRLAGTINRMFDRLQHLFERQKRFLAEFGPRKPCRMENLSVGSQAL